MLLHISLNSSLYWGKENPHVTVEKAVTIADIAVFLAEESLGNVSLLTDVTDTSICECLYEKYDSLQ
jgi:hypothetical protein